MKKDSIDELSFPKKNIVHLTSFDTVLKREEYELIRFLKYSCLANSKMALTDNQLIDNKCFLDFFSDANSVPGALDFLKYLFNSGTLIIVRDKSFLSFEHSIKQRIERTKNEKLFVFSALSESENKWVKNTDPSLDEFFNKFRKYKPWIEFLDGLKNTEIYHFNFSKNSFPELLSIRYNHFQYGINHEIRNLMDNFLNINSSFSRSQIYNYFDESELKKKDQEQIEAIKRLLIDDLYNYNLCNSNELKMLMQTWDNKLLDKIFIDCDSYEFQSEFLDVHEDLEIGNSLKYIDELSFEEIINIRNKIFKYIYAKETNNDEYQYSENYQIILFKEIKNCLSEKGLESLFKKCTPKYVQSINFTISSALSLKAVHIAGNLGSIFLNKSIAPGGLPELLIATAILSGSFFICNAALKKACSKEPNNWINFKQNLSSAIRVCSK